MDNATPPALIIGGLDFFDAPSHIEGSPYWVDLWASVNGYRIGLQVKPRSYQAASISIYAGSAKASQLRGHARFAQEFGGKVFMVDPDRGIVDSRTTNSVLAEVSRLRQMPLGPHSPLLDET